MVVTNIEKSMEVTGSRDKPTAERTDKRRVGRPRASGGRPNVDPAEDILRAAAQLFAERGFLGTSTGQIAAAAGLRQPAIFHWFKSKETILETLFSRGWDRSLVYFESISKAELPGAVKLCMCLMYDARFLAGADPHIQVMIVPPELRQPRFKKLLLKRQRLIAYLEEFIRQAIQEGDFRDVQPAQAARMALAVDEVVLDAARPQTTQSPQMHASMVVDFALHALAADKSRLGRVQRLVTDQRENEARAAERSRALSFEQARQATVQKLHGRRDSSR
jgi:AcrR family transcriptional regulator